MSGKSAKQICIALLFASCVFIYGCGKIKAYGDYVFFAMDTVAEIRSDADETALKNVENFALETEKLLSKTLEESDIYSLNRDGKAEVSEVTSELLKKTKKLSEDTSHAYDVCAGALTELWDVTGDNPRVPDDESINTALELCGSDYLAAEGNTVRLSKSGVVADLGGAAKGYCAEKCLELLKQNGTQNALVSFVSSIAVTGSSENNAKMGVSGWNIGIKNPDDTTGLVGYVTVCDKVVSVSGDYERYFEKDGQRYCHIFDIKTGYPAKSGLRSAAVICSDGALSDALSTALFVMGRERAAEFYYNGGYEFEAVLITDKAEVLITPGIYGDFTSDNGAKTLNGEKYTFAELKN